MTRVAYSEVATLVCIPSELYADPAPASSSTMTPADEPVSSPNSAMARSAAAWASSPSST